MSTPRGPSGPSRLQLVFSIPHLLRDPLGMFLNWHECYGDTVVVPIRRPPTLHLSNPDDIRHVLTINPMNYRKTGALIIGKRLIGEGLLASGEPLHHRQRRIAQPHFVRHAVESFAPMIEDIASTQTQKWQAGSVVDVFPEMARLTITIIGNAYFSTDLSEESAQLYRDFGTCQQFMQKLINLPDTYPTPLSRRYREAVGRIDQIVDRIIRERMDARHRPPDLLTTLLEVKDKKGTGLPRKQIRDELVNILLAGHETTAIVLSWTWFFLSTHPDVERKFHAELASVLGNDRATAENIRELTFTEMVINESMRLRPPVWILGRVALADDRLPSGAFVPVGTEVLMLPYIAHRNPLFFPDPERFLPERFALMSREERPPFVYFPFGGGPRGCIGETFARTEAMIILATVARAYSLRLVHDHPVVPEPLVTLRPKHGIRMEIVRRATTQPDSRATASVTVP